MAPGPSKKRVVAYVDGSNFYHLVVQNYDLKWIDVFSVLEEYLADDEELVALKYFICPVDYEEEPEMARKQQVYLAAIKRHPGVSIHFGKLAKRKLHTINCVCSNCGKVVLKDANCPHCAYLLSLETATRHTEKGVDVKVAINLVLDALNNEYDIAFLCSSDADFAPAAEYVTRTAKKQVFFCRFPKPITNDLMAVCTNDFVFEKEHLEQHIIAPYKKPDPAV